MGGWQTNDPRVYPPAWLPHTPGRLYVNHTEVANTTFAMVGGTGANASDLYAIPFLVPKGNRYTSIGIEVTTLQAGKNIRVGIYTDLNGVPDTLLHDAGTVSAASTGYKSIGSLTWDLDAGWYWLVCWSDGTPSVRATSQSSAFRELGFTSGTDTTTHVGYSKTAQTYGTLPNPFPASGALTTTAMPRVMLGL